MPDVIITTGCCQECAWRISTAEHFSAKEVTRATEEHQRKTGHSTLVEGKTMAASEDVA